MTITTLGDVAMIAAAFCVVAAFVITVRQHKKSLSLEAAIRRLGENGRGIPLDVVDSILAERLTSAKSTARILTFAAAYLRDRAHYLAKKPGDVDSRMLLRMADVCKAGSKHLSLFTECQDVLDDTDKAGA